MDPVTATIVLTMALPGVIGKCIDVSTNLGMEKWKNFSVVENAIDAFSKTLTSHGKETAKALRTWIKSDKFVAKAKQGGSTWPLDEAIASFIEISGIESSPVPGVTLEELIGEFMIELAIQLEVVDPKARIKTERWQFIQLMTKLSSIHDDVTKIQQRQEHFLTHLEEKTPTVFSYEMHDAEDRLPEEASFHSQIDTAVAHLKKGKAQLAKEQLLQIRKDVVASIQNASTYLTYRIAGNLGDCNSKLELLTESKNEYQRALNAKSTRLNYSNLASAFLNLNENQEALDLSKKAMGFKKTNGRTIAIHMHALKQNGLLNELASLTDAHKQLCEADPDCLLALGQIKYDEGDYEGAKSYFDKAILKAPYNGQLYLMSTNCILKSVENPFLENTPLDGKFSNEAIQRLQEAKSLIQKAFDNIKDDDHYLLLNRAREYRVCISFFEQDYKNAEKDCQEILKTDKGNQIALMKLGFLALTLRNDNMVAVSFFEQVSDKNLRPMSVVVAGAYINIGDLENAKLKLEEFKGEAEVKKLWYVYTHEMLRVAELENTVEEVISELLKEYTANGDVLYAVAELYKRRGATQKALKLFDEAKNSRECTLKLYIPRMKAQTYYDAGLWSAAADAYESVPNFRDSDKDWFEYIAALANIENHAMLGSAGIEAKRAREAKGGKIIPVISEIEAASELLKFEKPSKALVLLIDLWQNYPHTPMTEQLLRTANSKLGRDPLDLTMP